MENEEKPIKKKRHPFRTLFQTERDGFKAYFKDGAFVICRFSGTEPLLRIFAEDENEEAARAIVATMKRFVHVE